ncbi:hypothetical protein ACHHYP_15853 [Achlya hypogyna]|uniref:Uncharacterized protein n=1 Tax=Achlya hypogyna TaxID=1202772 RepID=A0A1V9YA31_ACHHY|nr:hypothetical protein ACHHYP_15853 [Achlya hypogyna]
MATTKSQGAIYSATAGSGSCKRSYDDDLDAANVDDVSALFDDLNAQERKRARRASHHGLSGTCRATSRCLNQPKAVDQDTYDAKMVDDVSNLFSSLIDDATEDTKQVG